MNPPRDADEFRVYGHAKQDASYGLDADNSVPYIVAAQQNHRKPAASPRWCSTTTSANQTGATDRYVGHSYPQVDTTGTERIRTFAIADVRMIRYLLFGRR